jgi:hypothetical protein
MTCYRIGSKASHSRPCVADWTGKIEAMLVTEVYRRLDRSLVLVPSDALRRQIAKNLVRTGTQRNSSWPGEMISTERPNTLPQTCLSPKLFPCSPAADHTLSVLTASSRVQRLPVPKSSE